MSNSSVFVDYDNDFGYVGDDNGKLHKVTPFFNASPAEVTTAGWPVTVSSATIKIIPIAVRKCPATVVSGYLANVRAA